MPELPEVETVCRGLEKGLRGARIIKVDVNRPDLRIPLPKDLARRLRNKRVLSFERRAKYILVHLEGKETLLFHLGMSGRMVIEDIKKDHFIQNPHDHLVFYFDNNRLVRFNDPRRFGLCTLLATSAIHEHKLMLHLGIEPFSKSFTPAFLAATLKHKKTSIKAALLDQRLVVGIGNIYACEALFLAGIHPERQAYQCDLLEIKKLVQAIRKVLKAAIKAGGSSLRDYVQADGELGYFQNQFAVYDREAKSCPNCRCSLGKTGGIQRVSQGGRSSFYCATKQI